MLFVVHAIDRPGALSRRLGAYDAHKSYLETATSHGVRIVISGPLVDADGTTMRGSFFLVEADDKATVERFNTGDPFLAVGVWQSVSISAFLMRRGPAGI